MVGPRIFKPPKSPISRPQPIPRSANPIPHLRKANPAPPQTQSRTSAMPIPHLRNANPASGHRTQLFVFIHLSLATLHAWPCNNLSRKVQSMSAC